MGPGLGVIPTKPLMMHTTPLTGHQGDPPTANATPQGRWGAVQPRYPPALSTTSGTPMPKLGPILTLNPFIWMSSGTLTPSTD